MSLRQRKSVTQLTEAVETHQPNISKHLKILQTSGLVKRRQKGNTVFYARLPPKVFLRSAKSSAIRLKRV